MTRRFSVLLMAAAMLAVTAAAAVACDSKNKSASSAKLVNAEKADKGSCGYSKSATSMAKAADKAEKADGAVAGWGTGNGKVIAVLTGSSCSGGAKHSTMASKTGCAICDEYAACDEKLTIAGASTQVVPLKNGVMFVYTSEAANRTHAVQAAVHRRNDRIAEISTAGVEVPLCDGCKAMRGAMASGKLHREVVNIEGGSLTLVTSEDPDVVRTLQQYSGVTAVKS